MSDPADTAAEGQRPAEQRSTAVAIQHGPDDDSRPRVIAKGHGDVAEQILALAFAADVKVRTDADLIEILEAVEIESEIPLNALAAVAEILSYVYRANGEGRSSSHGNED